MEAEDERRDAVSQPDRDDAERAAGIERESHQRDVVQGVAELARGDGQVEAAKVVAAEERERSARRLGRDRLELARNVEDGVGHDPESTLR